ncbi:unnamed protein product [Bursaphelenchus okinawaensis]|uniref:Protein NATD1 n=1 Tax=Bursaphelenchus okinawaensis TaxID=465554 RepID=A0A811L5X4_9BILA|nr:unnamed protein product [Bursaphelenchus okinawaensis]CAG9117272.1 unnamed protein product [Bursaphelenchus okinawaensis]
MQFFVNLKNGQKALLDYKIKEGNIMDMTHTFVPPEGRGQGLAEELVREGFTFAKANKFQIYPTCSYVARYAKEIATPEEQTLVSKMWNHSRL